MKRNLALLAIMLLLPLSSFAQYCLLGQVTDETGTSIQGAQLCLYQDGELAGLHNRMPKENTVSETCHEAATRWWQVVSAILLMRIRS